MKKKILDIIYIEFEQWASNFNFCCSKGCSTCCTQNVTITTLEAMEILAYCKEVGNTSWLANKLCSQNETSPPSKTTNEYIAACLEGKEVVQDTVDSTTKCPFLESNICTIYPVRPFSCRCFASTKKCDRHGSALLQDYYLSASMATMQIVEHLGQYGHWGNMVDVLLSLCSRNLSKDISSMLDNPALIIQARQRILLAKPIPGFFLPQEDMEKISPLLQAIFNKKIGEKTVEQILNGQ